MNTTVENESDIETSFEIPLTPNQEIWLYQHGGRSKQHVLLEGDGTKYILMGLAGGGSEKVYLPIK